MKTKLIIPGSLLAITGLVLTQIYKSGADHADVVEKAITLDSANKKLIHEKEVLENDVNNLEKDLDSAEDIAIVTDPVETIEVIKKIKEYITVHDTLVVHDTVYIKEQKNFWGKTKSDTL